jgi:hypothetical protein
MVHGSGLVQLSAHFHEKKKLQNRTLFYGNSVELQLLYMLLKPAFELVSWSGNRTDINDPWPNRTA